VVEVEGAERMHGRQYSLRRRRISENLHDIW